MNGDLGFRILFTTLWIAFLVIRAYYGRKARIPGRKRSRRERWSDMARYEAPVLVILRVGLFYIMMVIVAVYTLAPSLMDWAQLPFPSWVRRVGVGLGILTLPFLIWVGNTLGRHVSADLELKRGHSLVQSGPYSRVRHPMYTAYFTFNFAMLLVSANWLLILLIVAGLFVLCGRIKAEEKMLLDEFGDEYRAYMRRTGRLLPLLRPKENEDEWAQSLDDEG